MKLHGKQNYHTYLFNFYHTRSNVLRCLGRMEEAGGLILEALGKKEIRSNPLHEVYLLRSLADQQFSMQQFPEAVKTLAQVKAADGYQLLSGDVQLYVEVFELVNLYEAHQYPLVETLLRPLRKQFKQVLKEEPSERTDRFLDLFSRMNTAEIEDKRVSLKAAYKGLEPYFEGPAEHGNNEIILYGLYVLSKIEKRPYYELFVERMRTAGAGE
jgi:hypothetical protein